MMLPFWVAALPVWQQQPKPRKAGRALCCWRNRPHLAGKSIVRCHKVFRQSLMLTNAPAMRCALRLLPAVQSFAPAVAFGAWGEGR